MNASRGLGEDLQQYLERQFPVNSTEFVGKPTEVIKLDKASNPINLTSKEITISLNETLKEGLAPITAIIGSFKAIFAGLEGGFSFEKFEAEFGKEAAKIF